MEDLSVAETTGVHCTATAPIAGVRFAGVLVAFLSKDTRAAAALPTATTAFGVRHVDAAPGMGTDNVRVTWQAACCSLLCAAASWHGASKRPVARQGGATTTQACMLPAGWPCCWPWTPSDCLLLCSTLSQHRRALHSNSHYSCRLGER